MVDSGRGRWRNWDAGGRDDAGKEGRGGFMWIIMDQTLLSSAGPTMSVPVRVQRGLGLSKSTFLVVSGAAGDSLNLDILHFTIKL